MILLANISRLRKFRVKEVTLNEEDIRVITKDLLYVGLTKESIRRIFIQLTKNEIK